MTSKVPIVIAQARLNLDACEVKFRPLYFKRFVSKRHSLQDKASNTGAAYTSETQALQMAIPQARNKFRAHIKNLRQLITTKPNRKTASALIRAVLVAWQEEIFPQLRDGVKRPYGTSSYLTERAVLDFSDWLKEFNDFNVAAYWLASAYAVLIGEEERASESLYFTPPLLAHRVIDGLVETGASLTKNTWHDPACGGAAFLVPIAQSMARALEKEGKSSSQILTHIERNISGTDLEPTLLTLSAEFLKMALYKQIKDCNRIPKFALTRGNGLKEKPENVPDIVICNPPYRKLKRAEVNEYKPAFKEVIQGQPNIYGLFIKQSLNIVSENGFAGLLTPTSFLSGQYFSSLRKWLLKNSNPTRIEILAGRKSNFIDVEQETAIMFARRQKPQSEQRCRVKLTTRTESGDFEEIGHCELPDCGRPWPIAKRLIDMPLVIGASNSKDRISSYGYRARIGSLVHYRDTRTLHQNKKEELDTENILPLIWATDITSEGQFQHGRSLKSDRSWRFVQLTKKNLSGIVRNPSVVLQRVTSSDQNRRLVCTAIPSDWLNEHGGYVAENHVIVLEQIEGAPQNVSPELLAAILRTQTVDSIYRAISGSANVSIFELNETPLPNPEIVKHEISRGRDMDTAVKNGYEATLELLPKHGLELD